MKATAKLASLLLERLNIRGKPDLQVITSAIGLRVKDAESSGFDGALVRGRNAQKGVIIVRSAIPEYTRKRFTIAHEIGHYVIPDHQNLKNVCVGEEVESWATGLHPAEIEANEFAAELLLPEKLMYKAFVVGEPSLKRISEVARDFEASLTATTRRFLDLTDLACAMVWSKDGKAQWYQRSEAFPFYIPIKELPHQGSFAAKLFEGKQVPEDLWPIAPDLWLDNHDATKVDRCLEHSVFLKNYDATLTFLHISFKDQPDLYEEAEPLLEEMDPEQFTLRRTKWPR